VQFQSPPPVKHWHQMKILVDHGAIHNLGDTAMLESAVARLKVNLPEADVFVIARPGLQTEVWKLAGVYPVEMCVVRPVRLRMLAGRRFFWRYDSLWRKTISGVALLGLDRAYSARGKLLSHSNGARAKAGDLHEFCEPFDALHIVGGGNLTDIFCDTLFEKCCLIQTFANQGKPILLTGQQLGPVTSPLLKNALARTLRKATFVGLREPVDSVRFCTEAKLDPNKFAVMGDDSFGSHPGNDLEATHLLAKMGVTPGQFLAVNVRIGSYAPEHAVQMQKIAAIVRELATHFQMPVVVVPIWLDPIEGDIPSGTQLAEALDLKDVRVMTDDALTPGLVKKVLGMAFGAIGVSYHFCTFALSEGVPAICIYDGAYYSQKGRGLSRFWEDDRLALSLRDMDAPSAVKRIKQALMDGSLRKNLHRLAIDHRRRWQEIFDGQIQSAFAASSKVVANR
jgi:polysaccharide pyruvyl transferase WcaK-like protein